MALLPKGELPGFLFKSIFLRRLPVELPEHLVAKFADGLRDARNNCWGSIGSVMPHSEQ